MRFVASAAMRLLPCIAFGLYALVAPGQIGTRTQSFSKFSAEVAEHPVLSRHYSDPGYIGWPGFGVASGYSAQPVLRTPGQCDCITFVLYDRAAKLGILAHVNEARLLRSYVASLKSEFFSETLPLDMDIRVTSTSQTPVEKADCLAEAIGEYFPGGSVRHVEVSAPDITVEFDTSSAELGFYVEGEIIKVYEDGSYSCRWVPFDNYITSGL